MEITEEALKSSLNDLKDLEKSQKAEGIDKPLKKSADTPADAALGNSEKDTDLNKAGGTHTSEQGHDDMYKMHDHSDMKKMHGESDEDYQERMKKMGAHDDMAKNVAYETRAYEGQPSTRMEGESETDYAIRMKYMSGVGHENGMSKMQYSHANKENEGNELLKSFQEDGQLKKAIEVSNFLKSLVEKTTHHLSSVDSRLEKSFSHLLETIETQNAVITNLVGQYESLQKSFNEVLAQPVGGPRSVGSGVVPIGRGPGDLNKSYNNNQNPQLLKKSILNKMFSAVERGEIRDTDLIKFETTGEISNENLNRFGSQ